MSPRPEPDPEPELEPPELVDVGAGALYALGAGADVVDAAAEVEVAKVVVESALEVGAVADSADEPQPSPP